MLYRKLFNLILITISMGLLFGCAKSNEISESAFITINNDSCSVEEYLVYFDEAKQNFEEIGGTDIWETDFDGRSAVDVAKESALNSMIAVKVSAQKAKELNITLSEAEEQQAITDTQSIIEGSGREYSDAYREAVEKIMCEKSLYSKVKKAIVKDYVISESEYDAYCKSNYEATAMEMKKITVKALFCTDEAKANEIYNKIAQGESFDALYDKNNETGENSVFSASQKELEGELAELIDTKAGFVSQPIQSENMYGIFKVVNIADGDKDEIIQKLRDDYTKTVQDQIFSHELEKWTAASSIAKDESAWSKIDINS
jgi:hypothetical protein